MTTNDLAIIISTYFSLGLQYEEIIGLLAQRHNVILSMRTLKRRLASYGLYRRKNFSDVLQVAMFIFEQLKLSSCLHGYRWMHSRCLQNGFIVQKKMVRILLGILDPSGVAVRVKRKLKRRHYRSKGPNYIWHLDSYDKLKPYGICVNGCIDEFSRFIIWLRVGRSNNNPRIVAGFYVEALTYLERVPHSIRSDMGPKIDQRGKEVLDFCISKQIRILNGRVLGDTFGNFTCYTPHGASVVDYVAVSEEILENVLYFKVSRFIPTLSDCHCKLEWELSAKYCVPGENDIPIQLKNMTPNYIWTDCSAIKFQETLSSDTLQNYILEFNNSTIQFTQTSVDDASSKLSNIFLSAANLSLKRPLKKHTNKQKNKKWFDASLQQARTNLLNYGKIYSRFPYDPIIKNHFYKLNREYSKLRKYKYKQYKQSLISQLDSLHEENPKLYWNLINELQEKNETKKKCGVQPSTLISHFQKLSQLKGEEVLLWGNLNEDEKKFEQFLKDQDICCR
ncbi:Hypothetical predicted protein [Mytilus galloprovincialis]|uniref:Integrase catalytic domain-containing protein n=1 Tax=Mytilus galloprovincialis TaxID=29158 RepID=A0A8B6D8I6_MYTGA|nr:Hypothetical predicted protein [Mytilus galloprovincialis]